MNDKTAVLDHGYVQCIEHWGSDEQIIESARMSTAKGFRGWGTDAKPGDEKLLRYLWEHKHATPFEMAGLTIEVKLPLFVVAEWHRHRTQSYSQMSARYVPLPEENYVPSLQRVLDGANANTTNKQAQGSGGCTVGWALDWIEQVNRLNAAIESQYQMALANGIPRELARVILPVGRYTKMRASANLRNWLGFLALRQADDAQWEIREYANAVWSIILQAFPRTGLLYTEGMK